MREVARGHSESESERTELVRVADHAADPLRWRHRVPAVLVGLFVMGATAAMCHSSRRRRSGDGAGVPPMARGATLLLEVEYFCGSGPWPREKARWCCQNKKVHCEGGDSKDEAVPLSSIGGVGSPYEDMSRDLLVRTVKEVEPDEVDGVQPELDDDMDLGVVQDPCPDRSKSRRLKAARLRRLKAKSRQTEVEELLEEEITEIEEEEDPCELPEEAALKVEEVMDEALEAAEAEPEQALEEEEEELIALRDNIHNGAKGQSTSASEVEDEFADMPTNNMEKISDKALNATHQHMEPSATAKCSATYEDCSKTKCCSDPGLQCYKKNKWWSMCRPECIKGGRDPADVDPETWSCKKLGKRSPGKPDAFEDCHGIHSNCLTMSKCCKDPGFACFAKNSTFGKCMPECVPGAQYFDLDNSDPWECRQASAPQRSTIGNWTQEHCSGDDDDCRQTRCCATSGSVCYELGKGWAQCKPNCTQETPRKGPAWTCRELGYRTPPPPAELPNQPLGGKVGRWVKDECSKPGEDCSDTSCCVATGTQCYRKDSKYATCARDCKKNSTWSCKELGTRSWGLAYVGYPSLFCFSLVRVNSYEIDLVQYQWSRRAGIFMCDNFLVFSDSVTEIAGRETLLLPKVEVGVTKDGLAGNAGLFMKVWDMVFEDGTIWDHDWTVKADPDAVLLPDRLRQRLEPYTSQRHHDGRLFVVNCNAWPGFYDFPMMYGSVEIFSQAAMRQYQENADQCKENLPWQEWGEDFFLTHCMVQIDVGKIEDFFMVGDNACVGPGQTGADECYDSRRAAFHPFKDIAAWEWCFGNAIS